ncbi:hypothetical protein EMCRGX_G028413 [Ephydatia muelleri]
MKESKFSIKSDVWSFGIVLWELYSYGRSPYPSIMVDDVLEELENGYVIDQPDACPDGVYELMCKCWEMEPADRPSFQSLQLLLQQSFSHGEMAPVPTPPVKLSIVPQVESIIVSPITTKAYREVPVSCKATLHVGTVAVLGPEGSGKTSLAKFLKGEPFMIAEPPSLLIGIDEAYRQLQANASWLPVEGGLVYEDELVKIVIDDVLKHTRALLNDDGGSDGGLLPPLPLIPMKRSTSASGLLRFDVTTMGTAAHSNSSTSSSSSSSSPRHASAVHRLSGSYEVLDSNTPEGHLQRSGLRTQPLATILSSPPHGQKWRT